VFAPDGKTVFVAGWTTKAEEHGMALRAVDVATGEVRWERPIPSSTVDANEEEGVPGAYRLGITSGGRDITWHVPDVIHRYDVRDGAERPKIPTRPDTQAFILPGNRLLEVWWRHVLISDLGTGRVLRRWTGTFPMDSAAVVGPDARMIATAGWDGTASGVVATVDLRTGEIREMHGQQQNWIPDLAFTPDGSMLASIDDTGDVAVWDTASGLRLHDFVGHSALLRGAAWVDDGRTLVTAGLDNQMMTWDLGGDRGFVRQAPRPGPECADHCTFAHFGFTPDRRIATLDAPVDGGWRVRYLDPQTFRQVGALPRSAIDCCMAPAFSPDGSQIATIAPLAGTVTLRDATTGARIRRLFDTDAKSISRFPSAYATDTVAFSPDGSTVATNENADVLLIDPSTARVVARLPTKDYVEFISFSPDGRLIEAASDDGRVTVWDTATYEQVWQKKIDTDVALGGQFSPDGSLLIAGSFTGRIHVLDAATGEERTDRRILAHASLVGSLNFSPDGSIFATTGVDGLTYLWDAATGRSLGEPFDVDGNAMNAFSPDSSTLYVSTFETIYAFDVAPSALIARACAIAGRTLTVDEWNRYLPDRPYEDPCLD
jgi:WD40 repeat protein